MHRTPHIALFVFAFSVPIAAQTVANTINHSGSFVGGVAYDAATNEVIVIDETTSTVTFYDRVTGTQNAQFPAPDTMCIGGQVDLSTGNLWIGSENEIVFEVDRAGNILTQWSTQPVITDVSALTIDPASDTIWISNDSAHILGEFDKAGTPTGVTIAVTSSTDGDGCVYDPYTRTFLMGEDTANEIQVVDRTGALLMSYPVGGLGLSPEALAIDTTTGALFVGNGAIALTVAEVYGILAAPPAGASTHYGTPCGASIAVSDIVRDDGLTTGGTWVGYQSALPPGNFFGLNVGFHRVGIPLSGFLTSPCTLHAMGQIGSVFGQTNANGRYGLRLQLPPGVQGLSLTFWGADLDVANVSVPTASDGLQLIIQ